VGGRKLSDQEQILNLAQSSKHLLNLVRHREFKLDKSTFCALRWWPVMKRSSEKRPKRLEPQADCRHAKEHPDREEIEPERDTGLDIDSKRD
jgi:hypothetical protein